MTDQDQDQDYKSLSNQTALTWASIKDYKIYGALSGRDFVQVLISTTTTILSKGFSLANEVFWFITAFRIAAQAMQIHEAYQAVLNQFASVSGCTLVSVQDAPYIQVYILVAISLILTSISTYLEFSNNYRSCGNEEILEAVKGGCTDTRSQLIPERFKFKQILMSKLSNYEKILWRLEVSNQTIGVNGMRKRILNDIPRENVRCSLFCRPMCFELFNVVFRLAYSILASFITKKNVFAACGCDSAAPAFSECSNNVMNQTVNDMFSIWLSSIFSILLSLVSGTLIWKTVLCLYRVTGQKKETDRAHIDDDAMLKLIQETVDMSKICIEVSVD
jgi:hypothetical protein